MWWLATSFPGGETAQQRWRSDYLLGWLCHQNSVINRSTLTKSCGRMNADALQAVFDLILATLQESANDGAMMDCVVREKCFCFPILSIWIGDHTEHPLLNGINSKWWRSMRFPPQNLVWILEIYISHATTPIKRQRRGSTSNLKTPILPTIFTKIGWKWTATYSSNTSG